MEKQHAIYILASKRNGTLYIGVTGQLVARIYQHREKLVDGFSKRYGCTILVYYEVYSEMDAAIKREKQLKGWRREKKIALIEQENPEWKDL